MPFTPMTFVPGLSAAFFARARTLSNRCTDIWPITGWRPRWVTTVLLQTIFQLRNAVKELVNKLVSLFESERRLLRLRIVFVHEPYHEAARGSLNRQKGIMGRSSHLGSQYHLAEQLQTRGGLVILFLQRVFQQPAKFGDDTDYIDRVLWIWAGNSGHDRNKGNEIRWAIAMQRGDFCIALLSHIFL